MSENEKHAREVLERIETNSMAIVTAGIQGIREYNEAHPNGE